MEVSIIIIMLICKSIFGKKYEFICFINLICNIEQLFSLLH